MSALAEMLRDLGVEYAFGELRMICHGMRAIGREPVATAIPRADFALCAEAQGALGIRVDRVEALDGALEHALAADRPCVIDVSIDPSAPPPLAERNATLGLNDVEAEISRG